MILKSMLSHPNVLVAGDISFEHFAHAELMQKIRIMDVNEITSSDTDLLSPNHQVVLVKQGIWAPSITQRGFVLRREATDVFKSLVNLYHNIFLENGQDGLDIIKSNESRQTTLSKEDLGLAELTSKTAITQLKLSMVRWYEGFFGDAPPPTCESFEQVFCLCYSRRFNEQLAQLNLPEVRYEQIVETPEAFFTFLCELMQIPIIRNLSETSLPITQGHGFSDLSKSITKLSKARHKVEIPQKVIERVQMGQTLG